MYFRSLFRSSRAAKPAFARPVTPRLVRSLASSSNSSSRTSAAQVNVVEEGTYEKEVETSSEPITTFSGTRSYVVNEPDPADSKYQIPTGAYHSTAPYERSKEVKYEGYEGERGVKERSSSSSEAAHPVTTKRVPRHEGGVGDGELHKEGTKEGVDWVLENRPPTGKA